MIGVDVHTVQVGWMCVAHAGSVVEESIEAHNDDYGAYAATPCTECACPEVDCTMPVWTSGPCATPCGGSCAMRR
jgi:hypothetical protein